MDAIALIKTISQVVFPGALAFWGVPKILSFLPYSMILALPFPIDPAITHGNIFLGLALISLALLMASTLVLGFVHQRLMRRGKVLDGNPVEDGNFLEYLDFEAAKVFKMTLCQKDAPLPTMLLENILKSHRLDFTMRRLCIDRTVFERLTLEALKSQTQDNSEAAKEARQRNNEIQIEIILAEAIKLAQHYEEKKISIFMLFLALMEAEPVFKAVLDRYQILEEDVKSTTVWQMRMETYRKWRQRYWERDNMRLLLAATPVADLVGGYTVTLDQYCHDLAIYNPLRQGGVVLRQKEIEELENLLSKQNGNGVLLVGEIGSGRKSIVYNFANRVSRESSTSELKMLRILELDMVALIGANPNKSALSAVLERIFTEATKRRM